MGRSANALPDPPLLIITDRHQASRPLEEIAKAAFDAGARWISVREKELPPAEQIALHARVAANAPADAVIGIHSLFTDAFGQIDAWHLPRDGSIAEARLHAGPGALIGKSCHSATAVQAAAEAGVDYVTLSPVFVSRSKPGYGPALGLERLGTVCQSSPVPVIALGGLDAGNAAACRDAGAAGLAVMGDVMRASDPGALVRDLLAAIGSRSDSR